MVITLNVKEKKESFSKWKAYQGKILLQGEVHFMIPHPSKVSHIGRQQQSLLYSIGNVSNLPLLKISYGGVTWKGGSVQNQGGSPNQDFNLAVVPPLNDSSFIGGLGLSNFGLFAYSLLLGAPWVEQSSLPSPIFPSNLVSSFYQLGQFEKLGQEGGLEVWIRLPYQLGTPTGRVGLSLLFVVILWLQE